jgi:hypothetical protein
VTGGGNETHRQHGYENKQEPEDPHDGCDPSMPSKVPTPIGRADDQQHVTRVSASTSCLSRSASSLSHHPQRTPTSRDPIRGEGATETSSHQQQCNLSAMSRVLVGE